jgi:glyceraldehyde-3-phosphate dehydrogenase (NAD(P))
MVDNQAIVLPETIAAIRALSGIVRDPNESISRTNAALSVATVLI